MKKLIAILSVTLLTTIAIAQVPIPPWVSQLTGKNMPDGAGDQEGSFVKKQVRFQYNVATDGGSVAARGLGVYLPSSAIISRSYIQILTPFTSGASGGGTVALSCEDANNIKTATDLTGASAGDLVEGQSTGATSAFVKNIAGPCEITATVASTAQTAGKLLGWIEYIIGQ